MKKLFLLCLIFNFCFHTSFANEIKKKEIKIFKNIRCLVCQGQSISDSNSEFAQTIKLVIRDLVNQGKSEKAIYKFLIDKYGEWIVYKPTLNKKNFMLWFMPYLILLLGGYIILTYLRKRKNT